MLVSTLALGGAILGATTIAGLLMVYQIRATTDSQSSAKAIFAADSGIEWAEFDYYCSVTSTENPTSRCVNPGGEQPLPGNPPGTLANGATLAVICYGSDGVTETLCSSTSTLSAISKGATGNANRAFYLNLTSTSTYP